MALPWFSSSWMSILVLLIPHSYFRKINISETRDVTSGKSLILDSQFLYLLREKFGLDHWFSICVLLNSRILRKTFRGSADV